MEVAVIRSLVHFSVTPFFPAEGELPGGEELGLRAFIPQMLEDSSWLLWIGIVASSAAYVACPLFTIYCPVPAFFLSGDRLNAHTEAMADHNNYTIRQAAFLLKMVGGLHWARTDAIRNKWHLQPYEADPDGWRVR
ncbi:MAG: hypothetical protein GWP91_22785 [Rhodobacterales bacterium]|nr:hypothetical protein [Rhodobacterales bacterium]